MNHACIHKSIQMNEFTPAWHRVGVSECRSEERKACLLTLSRGSDTRAAWPGVTFAAVTAIPKVPCLLDGLTLNDDDAADDDEDTPLPSVCISPASSACLRRTPSER